VLVNKFRLYKLYRRYGVEKYLFWSLNLLSSFSAHLYDQFTSWDNPISTRTRAKRYVSLQFQNNTKLGTKESYSFGHHLKPTSFTNLQGKKPQSPCNQLRNWRVAILSTCKQIIQSLGLNRLAVLVIASLGIYINFEITSTSTKQISNWSEMNNIVTVYIAAKHFSYSIWWKVINQYFNNTPWSLSLVI